MIATAQQGETIDALCWRVLGRTAGVTEQVFALNPGLAEKGAQLEGGAQIILPDTIAREPERRQTVSLWD